MCAQSAVAVAAVVAAAAVVLPDLPPLQLFLNHLPLILLFQ